MRLLALDAATEACSVALWQDGQVLERYEEAGRSHSERLMALVREVLRAGQTALQDLDGIAASIGPGGFTGVRVTVSVAQGLAFGAGIPAIGVTTLEALAAPVLGLAGARALCCLDARMNEVYWGVFVLGPEGLPFPETVARVSAPGQVHPPAGTTVGVGRGFKAYPDLAALPGLTVSPEAAVALPRAADVARIGARRLIIGGGVDAAMLQPLYVRDKVALTEAERAGRPAVI